MSIHACRLCYPDSPHTPPQLWEWEAPHMHMLYENARTFHREVEQRDFPTWEDLVHENQHIWETYYALRPLYQVWPTWQAWMTEYRKIVADVQDIYGEHHGRREEDSASSASETGGKKKATSVRLQHTIPDDLLDDELRALLAHQARILEGMLDRLATTVTTVMSRPGGCTPEEAERLDDLIRASEEFLTVMAQQYVGLEQETAYVQGVSHPLGATPSKTAQQLDLVDTVTAALHANLTAARQSLADLKRTLKPHTTGA